LAAGRGLRNQQQKNLAGETRNQKQGVATGRTIQQR